MLPNDPSVTALIYCTLDMKGYVFIIKPFTDRVTIYEGCDLLRTRSVCA